MRRRLLALLLVALASVAIVGTVANAKGRPEVRGRTPPLPKLREVADVCPLAAQYRPAFSRATRDTGLPLAMLVAVGRVESNLQAGARYLELLLERFHSTDLALAAYNAGPTAVTEAGGAPSGETLQYVTNVTSLWRELRGCR